MLERAEKIRDLLRQPPYPDIHRTVSIFVNYAHALIASQRRQDSTDSTETTEQQQHQSQRLGDDRPSSSSYRNATDNINPGVQVQNPLSNAAGMGLDPRDHHGDNNRGPVGTNHVPTINVTNKEPNVMSAVPDETARPPLSRLPEIEVPSWGVMSNSITDSFGLFEDGQNDIFDFLHTMPSIPQ